MRRGFRTVVLSIVGLASLSVVPASFAGLIQTSAPAVAGGNQFAGAALMTSTTSDPTASPQANTFVTGGGTAATNTALDQTINPTANITLNSLSFVTGGQAGTTGTIGIYQIPSFAGGGPTDGFVNTAFSTNLLGGGSGLPFALSGSSGSPPTVQTFTFNGADQITLTAGTKYAIEFVANTGSFGLIRSTDNEYPSGQAYVSNGGTENNFNGTPPANGRGERDANNPGTDYLLALNVGSPTPEPASLSLLSLAGVRLLVRRRRA